MISLTLTVELQSPLHIGGETRQNTDAALPMLKTPEGLPYIPATSIKGRLRDETERLLRGQGLFVCGSPRPETMCRPVDGQTVCDVCALFGSPWQEAPLAFYDLHLIDEHRRMLLRRGKRFPPTTARASVRINRKRRVAEDNFLFDTELFQPGYPWRFQGTVVYKGDVLTDLAPLLLAARGVNMIGKARSRGLGWCSLYIATAAGELDVPALWQQWKGES